MDKHIPVNLVFEDEISEYVLIKLLDCFDEKYKWAYSYNGHGFGYIKSNINGFNQACAAVPFLVLTDLDNNPCPIKLIDHWFDNPMHPNMIFRIAIREVEAWLLADIEGCAGFLGISPANFPRSPEDNDDPKKELIRLTTRSRKRTIKNDIIPLNNNASIGPNYNGRLREYVFNHWDINRAMERCESLKRAYRRLKSFQYQKPEG